jgi:hypothetical protein
VQDITLSYSFSFMPSFFEKELPEWVGSIEIPDFIQLKPADSSHASPRQKQPKIITMVALNLY